uniref:Plectin/eS10 N-terminal domain-containing protein n=1 Tax=Hippocampus comes TaxID=109280 RepID=A0A3Q2YV24_HIPCM
MLMPMRDLRAIYEVLFRDGVMVAKKDKRPQTKHPEVQGVCNLQVIRAMGSLKSRGFVKETFAWRHFYWYLTNEGIVYLRDYLHLPLEIVPASLQRFKKSTSTLAMADIYKLRARFRRNGGQLVCTSSSQCRGAGFDSSSGHLLWSLNVLPMPAWAFSGYSVFLPHFKNMHRKFMQDPKLSLGVIERVNGCVLMCGLRLAGNQFRVSPAYYPTTAGMGSSTPTTLVREH